MDTFSQIIVLVRHHDCCWGGSELTEDIWLTYERIQERRLFIQGGNPNRRRHRSGFTHTAVPAHVFDH
jgi:hypothetical protein